ncbi:MAG: HD domain-containing protein [Synergistaceae bacterium]|nr:HD domain-containing protein [Synergistaceae bacterium]
MLSTDATSNWFEKYTDMFKVSGELPSMCALKKAHSRRVCGNVCAIREELSWNESTDAWLAYSVGLLHDVGRFPQSRDYGTFLDAASVDHGDLAVEILGKDFIWEDVPNNIKDTLLTAIKYHNKKDLPANMDKDIRKWAELIRDADKIDIFRMVQARIENGTINQMLPRHPITKELTPALVEEIRLTGKGSYPKAKSLKDYRLIQLTWGYDLNYRCSVAVLKNEGIFEKIVQDLAGDGIDDLLRVIAAKIDAKCA